MLASILQPIVFLLGGLGCGTVEAIERFFDPEYNCIISFDQRSTDKSTRYACLDENTWDLLNGIEKIRECLKIAKRQVFESFCKEHCAEEKGNRLVLSGKRIRHFSRW